MKCLFERELMMLPVILKTVCNFVYNLKIKARKLLTYRLFYFNLVVGTGFEPVLPG